MENKRYATDLSDAEWRCVDPHLPGPKGRGRPKIHGSRAILDAVFYVLKCGCPWRLLPKDFPPWKSVYELVQEEVAHRRNVGAAQRRPARGLAGPFG